MALRARSKRARRIPDGAGTPETLFRRRACTLGAGALALLTGCGGGAPLLHPAHTLPSGHAAIGAGASARGLVDDDVSLSEVDGLDEATPAEIDALKEATLAPGVAPYVAARVGIAGDNEAGITYSGRAIRVDARHAFHVGPLFISGGLGGSAIFPRGRSDDDVVQGSTAGGGGDIPILFGVRNASDIYALWIGPRGGFELLKGELGQDTPADPTVPAEETGLPSYSATHWYVGGLAGARVGFRHIHVALEVNAAYHRVTGSYRDLDVAFNAVEVTPAGALIATF